MTDEDYPNWANDEVVVIPQIEDREGIENAEAIVSLEGIDIGFLGPSDLAHSYGVAHEGIHIEHERVQTAFDKVAAATAKHCKAMGTAVGPGESMRGVATKGGRWFNCSHELGALTAGYRDALQTTIAITGI